MARKIFKQQKSLHTPYEMEITQTNFTFSSQSGSTKLNWKDLHKYKLSKDMILVYQSDLMIHMFPKRWFTDNQWIEFHTILKKSFR